MNHDLPPLLSLTPHVSFTIWGGTQLAEKKKLFLSPGQKLGETWEISLLPEGPSHCSLGPLNKIFVREQLPYLVKFIDTQQNLSIQVHPRDQDLPGQGKDECWAILQAQPGAGIYLGLQTGIQHQHLQQCLKKNEDLSRLLNFIPVSAGDFFIVPAGTAHAIGAGVLLCEVQQSSGITYRLWDWNRQGPDGKSRSLHIREALEVLQTTPAVNNPTGLKGRNNFLQVREKTEFYHHRDFKVDFTFLRNGEKKEIIWGKHALGVIVLSGGIALSREGITEQAKAFHTLLAPAQIENRLQMQANENSLILLVE
jgi:mannose-6-phosphate isomerase